nr:pumilio homolog 3 isoform X1 [Ciona intestinalis]|eukprot:XP_009860251.1 pumilio homolog 3 isoform X1 [Ciona intestinalis]
MVEVDKKSSASKRKLGGSQDAPTKKSKFSTDLKKKPKFTGAKKKFSTEKKELPKETAKTRKERKLARKKLNPNYELSCQAKKIWEKLRIQKQQLSKEEKSVLVEQLMELVQQNGKMMINLAYAHDTSRVLQTCLKQGSKDQRHKIFSEIQTHIVDMCKNGYAKNIVWKLLKYGTPEERQVIMSSFKGIVYKLMRKSKSASVVEYAYNNYATAVQRQAIIHEFYGRVFIMLANQEPLSLPQVIESNKDKKSAILSSFKDALTPLVDKTVIVHTVVHKALYDFFYNCDEATVRSELIEVLRESLVHILHTHDGAYVSMNCLWFGTKKDRKVIVKSLKEFVVKISCEEFGHLPLLAAFDCVDDTVFLKKALVLPIIKNIGDLVLNKYGRKVLIYLMSPRNTSHFLPEVVKMLSTGDSNSTSKKPLEQRHSELSEAASPGILKYLADNLEQIIYDRSTFVLVQVAVLCCHGDNSELIQAIVKEAGKEFVAGEKNETGKMHIIEDPCGHLVIKKLIVTESKSAAENPDKESTFSNALVNGVAATVLPTWSSCNRGAQILLALVENSDKNVASKTREILKKSLDILSSHSGVKTTKILVEKLELK